MLIRLRVLVILNKASLEDLDQSFTKHFSEVTKGIISKYNEVEIDTVCSHWQTALHTERGAWLLNRKFAEVI